MRDLRLDNETCLPLGRGWQRSVRVRDGGGVVHQVWYEPATELTLLGCSRLQMGVWHDTALKHATEDAITCFDCIAADVKGGP